MEKVIVVALKRPSVSPKEFYGSIDETGRLLNTAGGEASTTVIQSREKVDPAYLIGKGKVYEIMNLAKNNNIRTIVFDEDLTPAQQRNLEEKIDAKIIDRTRLILDIFAGRAKTKEAEVQIELAQLNYFLPRLTQHGLWLDGQVGGIGTRGPGERKIETDRRHIRDRIAYLTKKLEDVKQHREIQRKHRKTEGIPVISLVGYTNVGKSTILNNLSSMTNNTKDNMVYADDKLFATLDPTTRRITLPSGKLALLSDTVGFIRKLPHQLVASFRSTLEEILESQCLLNVVDPSNADYKIQEKIALDIIKELSAGTDKENIPVITVCNKIDLVSEKFLQHMKASENAVFISARNGSGIKELLNKIDETIEGPRVINNVSIPYENSRLINFVYSNSKVLSKIYRNKHLRMKIETDILHWNKIQKQLGDLKAI